MHFTFRKFNIEDVAYATDVRITEGTISGRKSHGNEDIFLTIQSEVIDQFKVHNVDVQLRIDYILEGIKYLHITRHIVVKYLNRSHCSPIYSRIFVL